MSQFLGNERLPEVRRSPHGSIAVHRQRGPLRWGWRVIDVHRAEIRALSYGDWISDDEAALWPVGRFGPDPVRVALDVADDEPLACSREHSLGAVCSRAPHDGGAHRGTVRDGLGHRTITWHGGGAA